MSLSRYQRQRTLRNRFANLWNRFGDARQDAVTTCDRRVQINDFDRIGDGPRLC